MSDDYEDFPCPRHMVYRGDSGPLWDQFGPANWRIKWKGDLKILEEIAFRRFGSKLDYADSATAVRNGEYVEVSICFRMPEFE